MAQDSKKKTKKPTQIAVVGMSVLLPDAKNPREFWDNIIKRHNQSERFQALTGIRKTSSIQTCLLRTRHTVMSVPLFLK